MPRLFQALILNKIKWFVVDEKKTMKIELPRPTSLSLSLDLSMKFHTNEIDFTAFITVAVKL